MKKLALTALAAAMATIGLASAASAQSRYDDEWPRHERRDDSRWNDRRGDDREARRGKDRDDEWRRGDRRYRNHEHRYPRYVYRDRWRDDYCFVKKVRRYDDWGNVYIKRIRVCR